MPRLVVVGDLDTTRPLLQMLPAGDYSVTLVPDDPAATELETSPSDPVLLLSALDDSPGSGLVRPPWPWLAWNRLDDQRLANQAYERGALAVLPARLTSESLGSVLRTAFSRARDLRTPPAKRPHGEGRFARGTRIHLSADDVLVVESGIVAMTALHEDGDEVLVALHGPGALVVGHPSDNCCLQLVAHSDVRAVIQHWRHVVATPRFSEHLRTRIRHLEAWAAVQARPHLQDRLVGLLSLLVEEFGRPADDGTCVDVRLTHGQLASAIGATRATVTRLIGRLRKDRILSLPGGGADKRFVLRIVERHVHSHS